MISSNRMSPLDDEQLDAPNSTGEGESKGQIFQAIWRHRWALVVMPILCMVVAGGYLVRAQKRYSSSARIYVQQNGPKILNNSQDSTAYSANFLATQCELIQSTPILAKAIESLPADVKTLSGVENPVVTLRSALDVGVQRNTEIININFSSPYPQDSGQIVNAVVDAYVAYQASQKKYTAAEVLRILEAEKVKRDAELDAKLKAMLDFRRQNGMLSLETSGGNIVNQKFAALSQELTQAEFEAIEARGLSEVAKKAGNDAEALQQLLESRHEGANLNLESASRDSRAELARLQRQADELRSFYGPDHRVLRTTVADLESTKRDWARLNQDFVDKCKSIIQQRVLLADQRVRELQQAYDGQRQEALSLSAKSAEFTKLDSDVKRIERLCDILDSRIKELNVTEDHQILTTSIVETAKSGTIVWPRADQVMTAALLIGVVLGLATAIVLDLVDQRLRSEDDIRHYLKVQVMGVVPHIGVKETASSRGQKVALEPMSDVAEAYRTLRTALYFSTSRSGGKKVLVTSPAPGDGKTTTASNLAIAIAQAGQRTLLIDADFRKPMQHKIFNLENTRGVIDVLTKQASIESVVHQTTIEGLEVLTCGQLPSNPAEVLNSQSFRDLLGELERGYDHIIVDSPPVAPVTDARILGGICDQTLLVLRAEKSNRKMSAHAKESLEDVGANVIGVVVNDVSRGHDSYGYYYGANYHYGHAKTGESNGRRQAKRYEPVEVTSALSKADDV